MERDQFEARNFIEVFHRPEEEAAYWRLLHGEKVPLIKIEQEGCLYREAVAGMIKRGEVGKEVSPTGEDTVFVSLQKKAVTEIE